MFKGASAGSVGQGVGTPLGQSTAILLIVLIVGACVFLWTQGYLRSRAMLLTIALILGALIYVAVKSNPIAG